MFATSEFWIFLCLFAFFGILGYFKVHLTVAASLDKRAADIAAEPFEFWGSRSDGTRRNSGIHPGELRPLALGRRIGAIGNRP